MSIGPPAQLAAIAAAVDRRVIELVDAEQRRWVAIDPELEGPFECIRTMVAAGGKRLRPAFCYWGFIGFGGDRDDPRIVDVGAAFELMHAFALFHDDVMDDAGTRRGAPTAHATYGKLHAAQGWAGESRRFGEGVAILVGDLAFVLSDELLVGLPPQVWRMWNELRTELNIGQFLDILGSVRRERRVEKAEQIARLKSGRYSIERPLHVGALLADPGLDDPARGGAALDALSGFGLPLGDAFQMRDDVMGVFGDAERTGKPVGGDLIEGKPTPLLARAVAAATPAQRTVLDAVGRPELGPDEVAAIQQVIVDTGALAALEQTIEQKAAAALAALQTVPFAVSARDEVVAELTALAAFVVGRSS